MTMPYIDPRLILAMRGMQNPTPAIQGLLAAAAPQQSKNLWDRMFGSPGVQGLISPEALKASRRQGLLQAGVAMLANADRPFGQALQAGLQAGQQGYQGQAQAGLQADQMKMRQDIQRKYAGRPDMGSRLEMFNDLVRAGLTDDARALATVLQAEYAATSRVQARDPERGVFRVIGISEDGKTQKVQAFDPTTGAPIGEPHDEPVDRAAGGLTQSQALTEQNRQFQRENALVDDYQRTVTPWLIPYNALGRALSYEKEAGDGNTAAQLQLLYAFINTLDNSVVREGEAAMFARAAPALGRARMMVDRVERGAVMTRDQVEEITDILGDVTESFKNRFDVFKSNYTTRAKRWGIDPESFIDIPESFTQQRAPVKNPDEF